MLHTMPPAPPADIGFLAIECVMFDANGKPEKRQITPLADLMRGLNVTLPVQRTIKTDRPGSV